ncbi:hypothetical protein SAMN04487969_102456 [Paenibacillus algorifonticola]|uniref:Uncharacterized protein n=1 Tax=Paenibacillus algorifonticola TaxID=684063 RepID=A0A1I2AI40_9BACL|nr:hypothetical protein [Paenibacillus algorifonticola]SFE42500.1 hypothetical protein SAMN04487969_102456 [Paenibacillus algorifonticola]
MKVFIGETIADGEVKGKLFLESDSMQFIIREYNGKVSEKGVEISKNIGYFTDIKSALNRLIRIKIMQSEATTLTGLHEDIARIEADIESKLTEFTSAERKLSALEEAIRDYEPMFDSSAQGLVAWIESTCPWIGEKEADARG